MFTKLEDKKYQKSELLLSRSILYKGEVCRLAPATQGIRVISGNAWLTVSGQDIMLTSCTEKTLSVGKEIALISTLQDTPLIFETWSKVDSFLHSPQLIPANPCLRGIA